MKYLPIDKNLFVKNRAKFAKEMAADSMAIFNSNDIYPISADSTLPFAQHRDIFYLSGVDQEESVLVLFPDCPKKENREILFLKETNEHIAVWEGEKLTKEMYAQLKQEKNASEKKKKAYRAEKYSQEIDDKETSFHDSA